MAMATTPVFGRRPSQPSARIAAGELQAEPELRVEADSASAPIEAAMRRAGSAWAGVSDLDGRAVAKLTSPSSDAGFTSRRTRRPTPRATAQAR